MKKQLKIFLANAKHVNYLSPLVFSVLLFIGLLTMSEHSFLSSLLVSLVFFVCFYLSRYMDYTTKKERIDKVKNDPEWEEYKTLKKKFRGL